VEWWKGKGTSTWINNQYKSRGMYFEAQKKMGGGGSHGDWGQLKKVKGLVIRYETKKRSQNFCSGLYNSVEE